MPIYVELSTGTRIEIHEETAAGLSRTIEERGDLPGFFGRIHGVDGTLVRTDSIVAVIAIKPDEVPPPSTEGTWLSTPRQGSRLLGLDDLEPLPTAEDSAP